MFYVSCFEEISHPLALLRHGDVFVLMATSLVLSKINVLRDINDLVSVLTTLR